MKNQQHLERSNQVPTIVSVTGNGTLKHLHENMSDYPSIVNKNFVNNSTQVQTIGDSHIDSSFGNNHNDNINNKTINLTKSSITLLDYFPEFGNDGFKITWNHAINTPSLMIEADVSLSEKSKYPIPIMAHPPNTESDLTLDEFLKEISENKPQKGIKLDLKSTKVVEPAFRVLTRYIETIEAPIILNADILSGDYETDSQPVDPWTFLMLCRTRFPKTIISLGWCVNKNYNYLQTGYSKKMIDQMLSVVKEYFLLQTLTFAVNASLVKTSINNLQNLLAQVPNSSLTIWGHSLDPLTVEDLILIRNSFHQNQLYYDLPIKIMTEFQHLINQ